MNRPLRSPPLRHTNLPHPYSLPQILRVPGRVYAFVRLSDGSDKKYDVRKLRRPKWKGMPGAVAASSARPTVDSPSLLTQSPALSTPGASPSTRKGHKSTLRGGVRPTPPEMDGAVRAAKRRVASTQSSDDDDDDDDVIDGGFGGGGSISRTFHGGSHRRVHTSSSLSQGKSNKVKKTGVEIGDRARRRMALDPGAQFPSLDDSDDDPYQPARPATTLTGRERADHKSRKGGGGGGHPLKRSRREKRAAHADREAEESSDADSPEDDEAMPGTVTMTGVAGDDRSTMTATNTHMPTGKKKKNKAKKASVPAAEPVMLSRRNHSSDGDLSDGFTDIATASSYTSASSGAGDRPNLPGSVANHQNKPFKLGKKDDISFQIPGAINQYLREYQREGIRFLYQRYAANKGALLGDDMGLGKTVQVIGLLSAIFHLSGAASDIENLNRHAKAADVHKPVLIVAPKSTVPNWKAEIATWSHLRAGMIEGKNFRDVLDEAREGRIEVVITTYDTCRDKINDFVEYTERDAESGIHTQHEYKWELIVFDEAHRLKNHTSKMVKNFRQFKNTRRKIGLSGTPLQNKWQEIHTLLDLLNPNCIGGWRDFRAKFANPLEASIKPEATVDQIACGSRLQGKFQEEIEPFFLQRMKDEVIGSQMPKKTDQIIFCRLSKVQKRCYSNLVQSPNFQAIIQSFDPCDCDPPWRDEVAPAQPSGKVSGGSKDYDVGGVDPAAPEAAKTPRP